MSAGTSTKSIFYNCYQIVCDCSVIGKRVEYWPTNTMSGGSNLVKQIYAAFVIPAYNPDDNFLDCIASALHECDDNDAIVVVDDGSDTPISERLTAAIRDNIFIVRQSNRGLNAARNVGLSAVCANFYFLLDSDDIVLKGRKEKQIDCYMRSDQEMVIIFGCAEEYVDNNFVSFIPKGRRNNKFCDITDQLVSGKCAPTGPSMMIPKQVLENFGAPDPLVRHGEVEYISRLLSRGVKFHVCWSPVYRKNQSDHSQSKNPAGRAESMVIAGCLFREYEGGAIDQVCAKRVRKYVSSRFNFELASALRYKDNYKNEMFSTLLSWPFLPVYKRLIVIFIIRSQICKNLFRLLMYLVAQCRRSIRRRGDTPT